MSRIENSWRDCSTITILDFLLAPSVDQVDLNTSQYPCRPANKTWPVYLSPTLSVPGHTQPISKYARVHESEPQYSHDFRPDSHKEHKPSCEKPDNPRRISNPNRYSSSHESPQGILYPTPAIRAKLDNAVGSKYVGVAASPGYNRFWTGIGGN